MNDPAETLIAEEEGRIAHLYYDSLGRASIGIGCLIDQRFPGAGLCDAAIDAQFAHDSATARAEAQALAGFDACNDVQRAVLVSMCFQLGNLAAWPKFKAALAAGDFAAAGAEGLNSQWARQTPKRAQREMQMLSSGTWVDQV